MQLECSFWLLFHFSNTCAGFVRGLNDAARWTHGVAKGKDVPADVFEAAYLAYRSTVHGCRSLQAVGITLPKSPLCVCPMCSPLPGK